MLKQMKAKSLWMGAMLLGSLLSAEAQRRNEICVPDMAAADHDRSYELCKQKAKDLGILLIKGSEITRSMAPGHFNALFLTDSNPLEQESYQDAFKDAKKQEAFIFWNHPGWDRQQPDSTRWWPGA